MPAAINFSVYDWSGMYRNWPREITVEGSSPVPNLVAILRLEVVARPVIMGVSSIAAFVRQRVYQSEFQPALREGCRGFIHSMGDHHQPPGEDDEKKKMASPLAMGWMVEEIMGQSEGEDKCPEEGSGRVDDEIPIFFGLGHGIGSDRIGPKQGLVWGAGRMIHPRDDDGRKKGTVKNSKLIGATRLVAHGSTAKAINQSLEVVAKADGK
ncbi:hypothetical protein MBM_09923 [Drepanopeziza brunnea f. sp. 'multigermtubi' MB_m1]|uniref:Uncharacterized protein n=1 Tax=Marssonina brunnea f. sp. multigermtubi (strain MB_m1) TaxID=1072389 RepID=K1W4M1_MARBU|nr:uncharacterized protein MBM_09923 [Drepanopeziza brunnea f. sp. 'multigermtubi' MB_m1]EKD11900.1 hypothetical protein MBM_09923 [Drepanopeziza brunnea f. sp. 'multigermtubi' MB_m1]